jgi:hypothetical protein
MFIEASVEYTQQAFLAQVSTQVLAMSLRDARATAEHFGNLIEKADNLVQTIRDPAIGQTVNLLG